MTIAFNVGDRVISVEKRDGMPIGSTGVIISVGLAEEDIGDGFEDDEILVQVEPNEEHPHGIVWYFYPHQLVLEEPLEILGDNDDDCI